MAAAGRLELVVVRHGVTQWNREHRYQGQRDIPLLLPDALPGLDRLREALAEQSFDAVHCSDLTRCRQTLAHVIEGREQAWPMHFDARLRELDFGDYEGRTYDELKSQPFYRAWIDSEGQQPPPGGESTAELRQRLDDWFADLVNGCSPHSHHRALVVCHGGVIRELRRRFEDIGFWEGGVVQAEGRRFTFTHDGERWQCNSSSAVPAPASAAS
ncbi:histidine phosphatase family protein [Billgrantia sulfidoxydans]|uniref:Histidine phosphatase family protein n=1 Tax=Billgrantia sulfidoxydans TaxID=2733484 RepID=A0ABX7W7X0_9GAMM|nr:histidine phosphatase family protein [Halomonas sulfidoxydans]QTP55642.1 histidine phosphatase family protein [Halomonas sulfidoxydans]